MVCLVILVLAHTNIQKFIINVSNVSFRTTNYIYIVCYFHNSFVVPACTENEFRCNVGHCIDSSKRCNGHRDCEYGEDEHGCGMVELMLGKNAILLSLYL